MSLLVQDEDGSSSSSGEDPEEVERKMKMIEQIKLTTVPVQDPYEPGTSVLARKATIDSENVTEDPMIPLYEIAERGYVTKRVDDKEKELRPTVSQYQIRPSLENKFKAGLVKEMIHGVLNDHLGRKTYSIKQAEAWTNSIASTVRAKVKDMGFARYKFVVQCVLGEERGAGVKIGARCLWDADSDSYASDTFLNDTIFCMTAVYAIYYY